MRALPVWLLLAACDPSSPPPVPSKSSSPATSTAPTASAARETLPANITLGPSTWKVGEIVTRTTGFWNDVTHPGADAVRGRSISRSVIVFKATATRGDDIVGFEATTIAAESFEIRAGRKTFEASDVGNAELLGKTFVADLSGTNPVVTHEGKEASGHTSRYLLGVNPFVNRKGSASLPGPLAELKKAAAAATPPQPFSIRYAGAHKDPKGPAGFEQFVRFETVSRSEPDPYPCSWTFRVADGRVTSSVCNGDSPSKGRWRTQTLWNYASP